MPQVKDIQDLSTREIHQLAHLLSLPPDSYPHPTWLLDQARRTTRLRRTLQRPRTLLSRLAMTLSPAPSRAHLCASHRALNPSIIRRIFLHVCAECTTHLTRLVESPALPPPLTALIARLHRINSLWMAPGLFRLAFADVPGARIESECEACTLANVGGDPEMLSDLRASMIGRKKKKKPVGGLLVLVEAWIDGVGGGDAIRAESDVLAREVRRCRREMQKSRKEEREIEKRKIEEERNAEMAEGEKALADTAAVDVAENSGANEIDEHDFEGSIIDFYANLISTTSLVRNPPPTEDIHPAFKDSIIISPTNIPLCKTVTEPQELSSPTVYSASIYSRSSGFGHASILSLDGKILEEYTDKYKKLV
jgi:hypothetical protein